MTKCLSIFPMEWEKENQSKCIIMITTIRPSQSEGNLFPHLPFHIKPCHQQRGFLNYFHSLKLPLWAFTIFLQHQEKQNKTKQTTQNKPNRKEQSKMSLSNAACTNTGTDTNVKITTQYLSGWSEHITSSHCCSWEAKQKDTSTCWVR